MRSLISRILAGGLGLLVALLLGEGLARLVGPTDLAVIVRAGIADGGMAMAVPDGRVFAGRPGFASDRVQLDERGLRPTPPSDGPCHVVVLGDSVAFGHGVPSVVAFPSQLVSPQVRVTNLSFPGWNTVQEAAALAKLGRQLAPDLVVVAWVSNDVASLEWDRSVGGGQAMYVRREVKLVPGIATERQLRWWRRSGLWRLASAALGGDGVLLEEEEHREALARIADLGRTLGAPVVLAQVPPFVDRAGWEAPWGPGRPAQPHHREAAWRAAQEVGEAEGLALVDLTEAVARVRPSSLGRDPVHPNPAGHTRIARVLRRHLAELAPRCGP